MHHTVDGWPHVGCAVKEPSGVVPRGLCGADAVWVPRSRLSSETVGGGLYSASGQVASYKAKAGFPHGRHPRADMGSRSRAGVAVVLGQTW